MSPDAMSPVRKQGWSWAGCIRRLLVALLLIPGTALAGNSEWIEVRSPHFSIYTNDCSKRGQDAAARFEEMRAIFGSVIQQLNVKSPMASQIVAFRDTQEFRQFAPMWKGRPTEVAGLFLGNQEHSFILLDLSMENPWQIGFHEYTHQLIRANYPAPVAPWFDEGLAEYFSGTRIEEHGIRIGAMRPETLSLLRQNGLAKVADLLRVTTDSRTYRENGQPRSLFYAQSELLMHFLIDRQLFSRARTYFDLVENEDYQVEEAVQQAFGMQPAEMDRALREYLNTEAFAEHRFLRKHAPDRDEFRVNPLTTEDSQALLADVHLQSADYQDKAVEQLQSTLRRNPTDTAAARVLGYFYLRNRDFDQAETYFRLAAQAHSSDARVHYYAAFLRSKRGTFGDPSALPEIFAELNTAVALDPKFADAYALMAFAELYRGNTDKAIGLSQKSINLAPGEDELKYQLARIYWLSNRCSEADAILRSLLKTQDSELAPEVNQLLLQVEEKQEQDRDEEPQRVPAASPPAPGAAADRRSTIWPAERVVSPLIGGVQGAIKFLKGIITAVDCSEPPAKAVTVISDAKTWTMHVPADRQIVVIGADKVSCSWNSKKVAVNYRQLGDSEGSLVSIEVQ